ncbi:E3 ubiquitin-protein ligase TRIM45-like [Saccostrea echinata]|uniref:E3 ubiquitin-protein ligase TRIM45-like n=1 Tax=Saccostrea echinata TaxID=191078 RepID=UPI002A812FD0|nr:E3 ubiquitin-protein ligase TRIM45-like [Saccostrea echinata]
MATATTAQDVVQCDICKNNVVHCDVCFVKLCKVCVGEHFSKELSKAHKIVDFKDRKSTLIFPQCTNHSDSLCESFCKDCNIPLCRRCVISSDTHRNHQLSIISDIFRSRKDDIYKDFEELKETIIPTHQFIASSVHFRLRQLESIYKNIKRAIRKHGEDWHKEVDKCVTELNASVQEVEATHINALKEHQDDITKRLGKIQDGVQQCKNLMESNDISLAVRLKDEIWISRDKIKIFNCDQASLVKSITTKTPDSVEDVVVTNDGKLAYTVYTDNITNIYINMKNGVRDSVREKVMTRLENWRCCDMYSTSSGDLLVIMECVNEKQTKVVKYANSDVKQTIQFDDENEPCKYISENRNFDICVADWGAAAIVVVNQASKLRFRYTDIFLL